MPTCLQTGPKVKSTKFWLADPHNKQQQLRMDSSRFSDTDFRVIHSGEQGAKIAKMYLGLLLQ